MKNNCELFGYFGVGVQMGLAILSGSILIIKWQTEWPKRSFRIWTLDVSKQGISSLMVHFINIAIAILISKQNDDDACVWYLVNILLDSTFGLFFEYLFVRAVEIFARKYEIDTLISGCYYTRRTMEFDDYNINYWIWSIQCFMWCLISSLMKVLVYLIMIMFSVSLKDMGKYILDDIDEYPELELLVVMILIPLVLNAFQFWCVDNFLKESDESRIERMAKGQKLLEQVRWDTYKKKLSNKEISAEEFKIIRKSLANNKELELKGRISGTLKNFKEIKKQQDNPQKINTNPFQRNRSDMGIEDKKDHNIELSKSIE